MLHRHLDLSGNKLASLAALTCLPVLHTLLLPGNCVASLTDCPTGSFASLEVLDLSFNAIQHDCLPQLGQWPQLRQLDVSGHALHMQVGSHKEHRLVMLHTQLLLACDKCYH